jgi:ribosomal protein S1
MSLGQCGLFKIINSPTKRSINLKRCQADENTFYDLKTKYQFDSYLPGARLTNCTIDKITRNGLQVNISNQLFAYVHVNHLPIAKRGNLSTEKKDLPDNKTASSKLPAYTNGEKLTGTIMFINPYSKIIYMSLLPHLNDSMKSAKISKLFLSGENDSLKLGQIIDEAQVSAHTFKGIYVKFKGPNDKYISGFLPKRHLFESDYAVKKDEEEDEADDDDEVNENNENKIKKRAKDAKNFNKEDIEKLFPLNSKLRVRIYDFSLIEDIILLSCRQSVLNALFMNYDELKIGQIVKCTVKNINAKNGGVSVKLSDFVTGFIPKTHTSDVPLSESMLPRKLKPGSELKCKIIQLNPEEKRCVLTAKQTLIKSKLPLIESFDQVRLGMETYGVVVSIQSYGMLVGFLNDMKGLLPRQEISSSVQKDDGQDLKKLYYLGQLVKCNVIDFDKQKETIKLSFIREMSLNGKKIQEKKRDEVDESVKETKIEIEYEIGDLIESATIVQVIKIF